MEGFDSYKTPYAYVRSTGDSNYGHMDVFIRNVFSDSYNYAMRDLSIQIHSQIGSPDHDEQRKRLYATRYGVVSGNDQLSLAELEVATKFMRKLERRMLKFAEELGQEASFAELCYRVILASGAEIAFFNPNFGCGYIKMEDLPHHWLNTVWGKRDCITALHAEEANIIARYDRRAA